MTALLDDLRTTYELEHAIAPKGNRTRDAYRHWFHQACVEGRPPDALNRYSPVESERFFARVLPGADGHSYWAASGRTFQFQKNDGTKRNPRYWWWEHRHGKITDRATVKPICGEPHCITVEHQCAVPWTEIKRRFTDEQCIGALQVAAQRVGRTPSTRDYDGLRMHPTSTAITTRFTSWLRALKAAGLPEPTYRGATTQFTPVWTADDCVRALQAFHAEHGYLPSGTWWETHNMKPSRSTIDRRLGSWAQALQAAGFEEAA